MTALITEARNASLEEMLAILRSQRAHRLDIVLPADRIHFEEGQLRIKGEEVSLSEDGATDPNGLYLPTETFDAKLAALFDLGVPFTRKVLRGQRPDLYDAVVNGLLHGRRPKVRRATEAEIKALETEENDALSEIDGQWMNTLRRGIPADSRSFLLRLFQGDDAEHGVARSIVSDRFSLEYDHYDGVLALLAGLKEANIDPSTLDFRRCDITDRKLYIKVDAPEVRVLAPELLKGYRNPFEQGAERANSAVRARNVDEWREIARHEGMGYESPEQEPIVSAGFVFTNSETGHGTFSIQPQLVVQICKNGLTMDVSSFGRRHTGARMDEGIRWSADTEKANLDLVMKQVRDVVAQFMSVEYVQARVDELQERSGVRLNKATDQIKGVTRKLGFTDADTAGILEHFMMGGQITAGGVMQAITSYSQTVENPDVAYELESKAVKAMDLAAAGV